ncbi:ATP-binding protein [Campylobacter sp. VBCF_06 NA8]|uniref:AAA family ATPase n=1 Tax=Campylobacter sp. VBCF_06 NA8 TaxID=2983822 RepID=UPI0022EA0B03|nr:AAA family ATPase [Campylobacter sp. VBCF_06 NA8]MDA3046881.1 ATP-binding protein [Campylobacter sp. VBCF_06 NA8]
MLKSFKVSGFTSIIDPISINFMAPENRRIKNTKYEDNFFENRIAKSVVLFGGNATGKTNILKAVNRICNIMKFGLNSIKNKSELTEKYELEFVINKATYSYILEFSSEKLIYEKLCKDNKQIYEFKNDKLKFESKKDFETIFSVVSKDTILYKLRDNQIEDIDNLIKEVLFVAFSEMINTFEIISKVQRITFEKNKKEYIEKHKDEVLEIVKILDNSIDDYDFVSLDENNYVLRIIRNSRFFILDMESSGIKKIFSIINVFLANLELDFNSIMLIDELDSSISTTSLIRLLNGFINSSINTKAQFIVTSHNPLIFDTDMLSPTQIYIVGKQDCKTTIKCLDEFELRNDKRKAYLNYLRGDYE